MSDEAKDGLAPMAGALLIAVRERDEWKARAEKAEAELVKVAGGEEAQRERAEAAEAARAEWARMHAESERLRIEAGELLANVTEERDALALKHDGQCHDFCRKMERERDAIAEKVREACALEVKRRVAAPWIVDVIRALDLSGLKEGM